MSKKPEAQPDDLIDQIMDAGQPQLQDSSEKDPKTEGTATPQADQQGGGAKPRKTAPVFIYLAILFAAAFMMLLLAYFVQQRNSENAIDDLRSSMTATREELMEQNQQLQMEKESLEHQIQQLHQQLAAAEQTAELVEEAQQIHREQAKLEHTQQMLNCLWLLEAFCANGDYELAACVREVGMPWGIDLLAPAQQRRWKELTELLIEEGYLTENFKAPEEQNELFMSFWNAIYKNEFNDVPIDAGYYLADFGDPEKGWEAELTEHSSPFTVQLYEELRDSLFQQGYLWEKEDGSWGNLWNDSGLKVE